MLVFLDIDGVLNQLQDNFYIDENCVKALSEITDSVVLVSTWKKGWSRDINKCTPQVKSLIRLLSKYNITIDGRTRDFEYRDDECRVYMSEHNTQDRYLILDDDSRLYRSKERLFLVNPKTGFRGIPKKEMKKLYRTDIWNLLWRKFSQ